MQSGQLHFAIVTGAPGEDIEVRSLRNGTELALSAEEVPLLAAALLNATAASAGPPQEVHANLKLDLDARPFELFAELLQGALQAREGAVDLPDLPTELVRVESDHGAAAAGELRVTLYPSDALLRFAAAGRAADADLGGV
ncbi:hypothetical protein [Thiorhodococcus fuscus]|uniref:Uncharacterized protein n=1 Tax=Thiorhodococcus fuscus TaxID=527200 RepID=A0ABW4Y7M0_9GAMM